jgi:N-acetylneuraminate lyase
MMITFQGNYSPLVTPIDRTDHVDLAALRQVVRYQLDAGMDGFYVCGGTGEGLLLTSSERKSVLETVLDEVKGRVGVIAHIGAFQTADTLELARHAGDAGVDAIAAIPPAYFYKPDTLGLVQYYTQVAGASAAPLFVYNIPGRVGITMTPALFDQLMSVPNIVGMKDSSGDLFTMGLLFTGGRTPLIFEGNETVLLPALLYGACGGIGTTHNITPRLFARMWRQYQAGDIAGAAKTQLRINELLDAIVPITGPVMNGAKEIMEWMGLPCGVLRSPNRSLTDEERAELKRRLDASGFFDEL